MADLRKKPGTPAAPGSKILKAVQTGGRPSPPLAKKPTSSGNRPAVAKKHSSARVGTIKGAPAVTAEPAADHADRPRLGKGRGGGSPKEAGDTGRVPRARSAAPAMRGMSVKWKIVLSTASIVLVAGLLTFAVIYFKAVSQLEHEIDEKGYLLVRQMMAIPRSIWKEVLIPANPADLPPKFENMMMGCAGNDWKQRLSMNEEATRLNNELQTMKNSFKKTSTEFDDFKSKVAKLIGLLLENPAWQETGGADRLKHFNSHIEAWFQKGTELFGNPLTDMKRTSEDNPAIVTMVAIRVPYTPGTDPFVAVPPEGFSFRPPGSGARKNGEVQIEDGAQTVKEVRVPVRTFYTEAPFEGQYKLGLLVTLSLQEIQAAKGTLLFFVIVPIVVTTGLGIAIAFFVGSRITTPLEHLMNDIGTVSRGNLDHETRPHSRDEIGLLASTFNGMTQALRVARDQEVQQKSMEHELGIAADIQANLLPKMIPRPEGYDIGAFYRPSKEVGGDYYDFIEIDQDNLGIIVADVSGKGIPGSMVMTIARTLVRMEADRTGNISPADTLKHVNRLLARDIRKGMFVTAMYCVLNKKTGQLTVCSAGHNPLVVWRAGGKIELVNPSGIALGFDKGMLFDRSIKEETIPLSTGDRIVGYTDGVVEAMSPEREEFGDDRFHEIVKNHQAKASNEFVHIIADALDDHKSDAEQHDDITIVTVRKL